jgi:hypothetical protein
MEARSKAPVTFDSEKRCPARLVPSLTQIKLWIQELTGRIFEIQLMHFKKVVTITKVIYEHVLNTPDAVADCEPLEAVARRRITLDPDYQVCRSRRHKFLCKGRSLISHSVTMDILAVLQAEVLRAIADYEPSTTYSPPGPFDGLLEEYIRRSPDLSILVIPAATVVAEGTTMAMMSTLSEFNLAVLKPLGINSAPVRAIVYTSLVRFLFGIGYTVNPAQLLGKTDDNAKFLMACDRFAAQTVRDLVLTKAITQQYTPGLTVRSMFRSKQVDMLRAMETMTNPIDLMYYVHTILGSLASFFASTEKFLSFDDTLTLLLALMSISPPGNAIAIAAFVSKWEPVQLSSVVSVAKNYFVAAVEQIQLFGGMAE